MNKPTKAVRVRAEVFHRLKVYAASRNKSFQEVATEAIDKYIEEKEKKQNGK